MLDSSNGGIYSLRTITVAAGTTVTWTQVALGAHTVQSSTNLFNSSPGCMIKGTGPGFRDSTGCMKNGDTFSFTFRSPGQYFYYCLPHGSLGDTPDKPTQGMAGVVVVE